MAGPADWFQGAIDLHTHSRPSVFPRRFDDVELARHAARASLSAIVLKAHEGSSVERASLAGGTVSGIAVRGGVVLNHFVGGLNPHAVEMAVALGASIVWMPTLHAENHIRFYGEAGFREQKASVSGRALVPLTVLDDRERLRNEVQEILEVLRAHQEVILSNGHLDGRETRALFGEARRRGIERLVVAHPGLPLTSFGLELQLELARLGAIMEHTYLPHLPRWGGLSMEVTAEHIRRVGVERSILASDLGQSESPPPAEGLQEFGRNLIQHGLKERELRTMLVETPAALLGLQSSRY